MSTLYNTVEYDKRDLKEKLLKVCPKVTLVTEGYMIGKGGVFSP
jgi:hypothetical protein